MIRIFSSIFFLVLTKFAFAQINIASGSLFIQSGTTLSLRGDLTSNANISGNGKILLRGVALQNINMNGNTIPNLELDNNSDADLISGDTRIGTNLKFTNGKFRVNNNNLIIGSTANISGANSSRFVLINGMGQLKKEINADIFNYEFPVGENGNYRPAFLTTSGSIYTNASVGVCVLGMADSTKPNMVANYINTGWPVTKTGIAGGSVVLEAQYLDPADIVGNEYNLIGYYFNGTDWSSAGEMHNPASNRISVPLTSNTGILMGMNKFVVVGARAFLQGAYVSSTGLMSDNLRSLPLGTSANLSNFPDTDPYRVAPYNSSFFHTNNPNAETILNNSVVSNQPVPANDIVDWVFLELRNLNPSPGNFVLATRSALIQRDGDIVDMDGVSPVTFNNILDGNYILAVRHRNHLGLSIDQNSPRALNETKSTAFTTNLIDFTTASDPQLFGNSTAFTTSNHPTLGTVNLLWGGNANINANTKFTGLNNDKDYLLINTLGNIPSSSVLNIYHSSDLNMNKAVKFTGLNNDKDFLLINVLGNITSTTRTQALPN